MRFGYQGGTLAHVLATKGGTLARILGFGYQGGNLAHVLATKGAV